MRKTFAYHKPGPKGVESIQRIRLAFSALADVIDANCTNGRERALAHTNLEQACMWATKAVVMTDPEAAIEE